jgi:hypothetical protein
MPKGFEVETGVATAGRVGSAEDGEGEGSEGCVQETAEMRTAIARRIRRVCG